MFGIYSRVRRGLNWRFRASIRSNPVAPMSTGRQSHASEPTAILLSEPAVVEDYWTDTNVTNHRKYASTEESLRDFRWRNAQYLRYIELMPVVGADDMCVLDFGCGPGHDLVGFGTFSNPKRLIGVDVSKRSLVEAAERLTLHAIDADLIYHDVHHGPLPLETGSVDLVHCSGVLHHLPDPHQTLAELRRVLRPGGTAQFMVYNYRSVFVHLYVAYQRQVIEGIDSDLDVEKAFARSTDGPDCPISRAYRPHECVSLVEEQGFHCANVAAAISTWEMSLLPRRFEAIMDRRLREESRDFLASLRFDELGFPYHGDLVAGVDGCYKFIAV
jgi:SAM-dependent methyltransferase